MASFSSENVTMCFGDRYSIFRHLHAVQASELGH